MNCKTGKYRCDCCGYVFAEDGWLTNCAPDSRCPEVPQTYCGICVQSDALRLNKSEHTLSSGELASLRHQTIIANAMKEFQHTILTALLIRIDNTLDNIDDNTRPMR